MFFCFRRRHYDKSSLIWLSNMLFGKHGEGDSNEQVWQKVLGIVAFSETQTNRQSSRTWCLADSNWPACTAATVIINVLIEIVPNVNANTAGSKMGFVLMWFLSILFGEKFIKSYTLPLGYNFHPQLDFRKKCGSSSCNVSSDLPWKLFEGCWHSFHLECLRVLTICVICRDSLQKNLQSLSKTANEAFVRGVPLVPEGGCWEEAICEETTVPMLLLMMSMKSQQ